MSKKKSKQKRQAEVTPVLKAFEETMAEIVNGYSRETVEIFEDEVGQRMASGYSYEEAAKYVGEQNEEPWKEIMLAIETLKRLENRTMA